MSEIELCKILVNQLKQEGYEVFQEVETTGGRVDVVAAKNGKQWAIEVKKESGGLLNEQAKRWTKFCDYSSIASPNVPRIYNREYCLEYGIGILVISKNGYKQLRTPRHNINAPGLIVYEEQKDNIAGVKHSPNWMPSKQQRSDLRVHFNKISGREYAK